MTLADFIIVKVVCRSDLHATSTEFGVDIFVSNDRNDARGHGYLHAQADKIGIAFIARTYRQSAVGEDSFRSCGGDFKMSDAIHRAVDQRVTHVIHESLFFDIQYFEIGNCGMQYRIPVDQAFATVNQVFFVKLDKHFLHRRRKAVVHGKAFARPVG